MSQPKPWSMNGRGQIVDAECEPVVLSRFSLKSGLLAVDNDAFVVRAVNCYGDLLAACEKWLAISGPQDAIDARFAIQAAVKKARGQ